MDITDVKRLRGTPLGVVGAYSGPSGAPPVAPVAPNRCPCAVLLSTGRGVLHLARECLGLCGLLNLTNVEDSGCTFLRVHLGSLLASGPALALVL